MFPQIGLLLVLGGLVAAPLAGQEDGVVPPRSPQGDVGVGGHQAVRLAMETFAVTAEVEVRDLPDAEARAAAQAALLEILEIERLVAPDGEEEGGIGQLNRAAGQGALRIDPRVAELLVRSLQFCIWTNGAWGPLGGELERLWAERQETRRPPPPTDLGTALGSAECDRLGLTTDTDAGTTDTSTTAELLTGSRISLRGLARGFAVDRAVEVLAQHGAGNAWVQIGLVSRALGGRPRRPWLARRPAAGPGRR